MKFLGICLLTFFMLAACANNADLMPEPRPNATEGREAFCERDGNELVVRIKNNGTEAAPASTTRVTFEGNNTMELPTPQIPANGMVEVKFAIPSGCHNPDCDFTITVDAQAQVQEGNETNNTAEGRCIG